MDVVMRRRETPETTRPSTFRKRSLADSSDDDEGFMDDDTHNANRKGMTKIVGGGGVRNFNDNDGDINARRRLASGLATRLPEANPIYDHLKPSMAEQAHELKFQRVAPEVYQLHKGLTRGHTVTGVSGQRRVFNGSYNAEGRGSGSNGGVDEGFYEKYHQTSASGGYRQVYSKYAGTAASVSSKAQQEIDLRRRFAGCLVNLSPLLRPKKQEPGRQATPSEKLLAEMINAHQPKDYSITAQTVDTSGQIAENTVVFDSRFESGNLLFAYEKSSKHTTTTTIRGRETSEDVREYDLFMQCDVNSKGYTQWFFFSLTNVKKGSVVRLNIVNHVKKTSQFSRGMLPAVLSMKKNAFDHKRGEGVGHPLNWQRSGFDVVYEKNQFKRANGGCCYSLSFSYRFEFEQDTVYFAMGFPYTYTDMLRHLDKIEANNSKTPTPIFLKRETLCTSIAGHGVPLLTIGDVKDSHLLKRFAFVIGRQHPGETVSSFVMEGLIDFLVSSAPEAVALRRSHVFKIVPMVNPDGVIYGNFRCNLSGVDLNRQWANPNKYLHPCVYYVKRLLLQQLHSSTPEEIDYFIDLHGHSKKLNAFLYACRNSVQASAENTYETNASRVLPLLLSKINKHYDFYQSTFGLEKGKEGTARGVAWGSGMLKPNIFTVEVSFFGFRKEATTAATAMQLEDMMGGNKSQSVGGGVHFTIADLACLGSDLCRSMAEYNSRMKSDEDPTAMLEEVAKAEELRGGKWDSDSGSDSEPEADELEVEEKRKKVVSEKLAKEIAKKGEEAADCGQRKTSIAGAGRKGLGGRVAEETLMKEEKSGLLMKILEKTRTMKKRQSTHKSSSLTETSEMIKQQLKPRPATKEGGIASPEVRRVAVNRLLTASGSEAKRTNSQLKSVISYTESGHEAGTDNAAAVAAAANQRMKTARYKERDYEWKFATTRRQSDVIVGDGILTYSETRLAAAASATQYLNQRQSQQGQSSILFRRQAQQQQNCDQENSSTSLVLTQQSVSSMPLTSSQHLMKTVKVGSSSCSATETGISSSQTESDLAATKKQQQQNSSIKNIEDETMSLPVKPSVNSQLLLFGPQKNQQMLAFSITRSILSSSGGEVQQLEKTPVKSAVKASDSADKSSQLAESSSKSMSSMLGSKRKVMSGGGNDSLVVTSGQILKKNAQIYNFNTRVMRLTKNPIFTAPAENNYFGDLAASQALVINSLSATQKELSSSSAAPQRAIKKTTNQLGIPANPFSYQQGLSSNSSAHFNFQLSAQTKKDFEESPGKVGKLMIKQGEQCVTLPASGGGNGDSQQKVKRETGLFWQKISKNLEAKREMWLLSDFSMQTNSRTTAWNSAVRKSLS